MKPSLNRTVYTVYKDSITKSKVAYLGKDSFIIEHFNEGYDYGYEYDYKAYNYSWFTSLAKAKKSVWESLTEEEKKEVKWEKWSSDDYWELVYRY